MWEAGYEPREPNPDPEVLDEEIRAYIREHGLDRNWGGWGPKRNSLTWEDAHKELIKIKKNKKTGSWGWGGVVAP
ncbi:MAG: hypothetical protein V4699_00255 [Patescibacteria group bacterium]